MREAAGHLMAAGGKRFRPMLALLAAQLGDPERPRGHLGRGGLRADPPGDALPRRRHGRGRRPPRGAQRQQPLDQQHRHPHRRPAVRPGLGPAGRPGAGGGPHPGAHLRAAGHRPDPRDGGRPARRRPGRATTSRCWRTRPARWSPPPPASAPRSPGSTRELVDALTAFGEEVGVAFQLSDDLIDIVSVAGASGKSPGTDLREGIATLPVLFALAGDDPDEARLRELVAGPGHRRRRARRGAGAAALVPLAGAGHRRAARVRRPRAGPAGRRPGRRRPRRPVGAVRLRGDPHQ